MTRRISEGTRGRFYRNRARGSIFYSTPAAIAFAEDRRARDHLYFISVPPKSFRRLRPLLRSPRVLLSPSFPFAPAAFTAPRAGASGADYTVSRRSVSHELGIGQVNESFPRQFRVIIEQTAAPLEEDRKRMRVCVETSECMCMWVNVRIREYASKIIMRTDYGIDQETASTNIRNPKNSSKIYENSIIVRYIFFKTINFYFIRVK